MSDREDNASPRDPTPRLVFFDLDGTITRRDTLLPYVLAYATRSGWRLAAALGVAPTLLKFTLGRADHGRRVFLAIRAITVAPCLLLFSAGGLRCAGVGGGW